MTDASAAGVPGPILSGASPNVASCHRSFTISWGSASPHRHRETPAPRPTADSPSGQPSRGYARLTTVRATFLLPLAALLVAAPGCTKKNAKQSLAAMAVAPAARDDWWEPRRDPDPFRPLGAEITYNPYHDKEALFDPTPEESELLTALAPIMAGIALFIATGEIPAILFVQPLTPTK